MVDSVGVASERLLCMDAVDLEPLDEGDGRRLGWSMISEANVLLLSVQSWSDKQRWLWTNGCSWRD